MLFVSIIKYYCIKLRYLVVCDRTCNLTKNFFTSPRTPDSSSQNFLLQNIVSVLHSVLYRIGKYSLAEHNRTVMPAKHNLLD